MIKDRRRRAFAKDVIEASRNALGARRLLGDVVRALQAAHADPGEGRAQLRRQSPAGEDRTSTHNQADRRATAHPVAARPSTPFATAARSTASWARSRKAPCSDSSIGWSAMTKRPRSDDVLNRGGREAAGRRRPARRGRNLRRRAAGRPRERRRRWPGWRNATCKSGDVERARADASPWCRPISGTPPAVAAVRAALDLAEQGGQAGDLEQLEARIAADPADHQARFDLAMALAGLDRRRGGDRTICSSRCAATASGTRKRRASSFVQFFDAWGPKEPISCRKAAAGCRLFCSS